MRAMVCIPFRDRGIDPLRAQNLAAVRSWWQANGHSVGGWLPVHVISDRGHGYDQFNRSAAYNRGARVARDLHAEVIVYAESDMLIDPWQVMEGIRLAAEEGGLVVPFTSYRYLSAESSVRHREGTTLEALRETEPQSVMENGASIGAINIVSLKTLDAIGQWDENFSGSWYDDNAMHRAFEVAAGPTRWVEGPAWHLFHLPGWGGDHLTDEDRAATARNQARWERYQRARTPEQIRRLTEEGT